MVQTMRLRVSRTPNEVRRLRIAAMMTAHLYRFRTHIAKLNRIVIIPASLQTSAEASGGVYAPQPAGAWGHPPSNPPGDAVPWTPGKGRGPLRSVHWLGG